MIPSILARQLHQGVRDYIGATFPVASPYFRDMIKNFLDKPGNVYKGPYYQLGLPFSASPEKGLPFDSLIDPEFRPYEHQRKAWSRLSGDSPLSTIVATGTGSGKTECFLFPILDWCSRHQGKGIKAILIYPMNALADDQSRRIAKLIATHPALSGIRAAVYTGDSSATSVKVMSDTELITDRDTIREYPPDILLTNYKMLDLLLLRARDRGLWDEKALRFLVVDELHSFDGAQGTDLACLIRRLRERVGRSERESLACVGTSATLGDGSGTADLLDFATKIFLADFDANSVITETRQSDSEFFSGSFVNRIGIPSADQLPLLEPFSIETEGDAAHARNLYLETQMRLWFPDIAWSGTEEDRVTLGAELKNHGVFQNLVRFMDGKARSVDDLIQHFRKTYTAARSLSDDEISLVIDSVFSLISHARVKDGARIVPFLTVRTQLWLRELRRLVSDVVLPSDKPDDPVVSLRLADEIPATDKRIHLPVVHCRECNTLGWLTREAPGDAPVISDLRNIYNGYFNEAKDTIILYPKEKDVSAPRDSTEWRLCPECGYVSHPSAASCAHCHHIGLLPVHKSHLLDDKGHFESACPRCGGAGDLAIMGAQAASLLSSLVGQTFSSPFNTDKKLLAFSDSVQDAAHRAGFLTSRAWTFGFRTAIARSLENGPERLSIPECTANFIKYWKTACKNPEDFIGTFIPPDLTWMNEYEELKKNGTLRHDSTLSDFVERRLSWEIASEFTFRSGLGRTLEKSRAALAFPARSALDEAARLLGNEASERQERFRSVPADNPEWKRFLRGILLRMKTIGAVNEPSILPLYLSGNTYTFHRSSLHMPQFYPRVPRVLAENPCKKNHEQVFVEDRQLSWFSVWWDSIKSRLMDGLAFDEPELDAEVLRIALDALCRARLTEELELPGHNAGWMLDLRNMIVSRDITAFTCSACGARIQGCADETSLIEGMACLRPGCHGSYQVDMTKVSDYYRDFYRRGEVVRINGYEHTGLLEAKERKTLEESFIDGTHPWNPNFLSATPTLEMGINIGDLSTVFLCSVPPAVANYLQRIGRSGRTDGNAHVLALANADPHDQYFYQSPEDMIAGSIETPAIYDHAVSVLERHLTAYAMGQWIQLAPRDGDPVPRTLGDLLVAFGNDNAGVFPIGFFESVAEHRDEWLSGFFTVFDQLDKNGDEEQYLRQRLSQDGEYASGIERKITERITLIKESIDSFRSRRDKLNARIVEIKQQGALTEAQGEELKKLEHENGSVKQSIKDIRERQTWEFLCDEGILPNYAFPETGVKLNATFWRSLKKANGSKEYAYTTLELVRSPSSALRDFAPKSVFYGNGHRMTIDRVDLRASRLETWRFCPSCSHAVPQDHEDYRLVACPLCGNAHWSDKGQSQNLLRFRQVFSFSSYRESLISDSAEDREPTFYNTKLLIDFDPKDARNVYFGLEDASASVGVEFIQRAVFREINFGRADSLASGFPVAGDQQAKPGFPVCLQCGAIDGKSHAPECPNAKKTDTDGNIPNALHLYHEFASEAIRILVPVSEFSLEGETAVQSLIAAIYLGLKRHFGGKADHLRIMSEQSQTSGGSVLQYIVIYDTIPGGSGYLKDFFRDAHAERATTFFLILDKALEALLSCECRNDPEKDGCYHCVLSHRMSYHMRDLSRKTAIDVVRFILAKRDSLVRVHTTAASRVNPAYDSRLEELFVAAIKSPELWPVPTRVEPEIFHDKPGHFVSIGSRSYHLETHVYLRVHSPVPVNTEPDFVFWPTAPGEKQIAIYTDGFTYHKNILADDLKIRQSLLANGGYRVFSFTWDDVDSLMDKDKRKTKLDQAGHPWITRALPKERETIIGQLNLKRPDWPGTGTLTGLTAFISMLSLPEADRDALWLDKARYSFLGNLLSQEPEVDGLTALGSRIRLPLNPNGRYSRIRLSCENSLPDTEGHELTLVLEPPHSGKIPDLCGWLVFNDNAPANELEWQSLLDLLNLYQIFPKFAVTARSFASEPDWMTQFFPEQTNVDDDWRNIYQEALAEWKSFIDHLASVQAPLPVVGYEFEDSDGSVCGCAELAWPDRKIAVFNDESECSASGIPSEWRRFVWFADRPFPEIDFGGNA